MAEDPTTQRPAEPGPKGETPTATTAQAAETNEEPGQESEEAFDKERALATIRTLRAAEKAAKQQSKELEQLKARLAEHEQAQLSASEKAELRAVEAERKAQAAEAKAKAVALKASVERFAHKLGVIDDDAAYKLLDLTAVEYGDDGEPQNVEALLNDLVKVKPYLVAKPAQTGVPATPTPANGKAISEAEQARQKSEFQRLISRW